MKKVTKEFISKTTFLSFPGLTGLRLVEGIQKTLDARLSLSPQVLGGETSGMTYKDLACDFTNDRISKDYLKKSHPDEIIDLVSFIVNLMLPPP